MDHCASVLLAFPPTSEVIDDEEYHKAARLHIQKVERLINDNGSAFPIFAQQLVNLVHPAEHSISYLALLTTLLQQRDAAPDPLLAQQADSVSGPVLLQLLATFLLTFDPRQIRYVGVAFSNLLTLVEEGQVFSPSIAVELGTAALLRIDPTGSMLTSHHLALVTLAYTSDNIELVLPLIKKTIVFYPGVKSVESRYPCDMTLSPVAHVTPESGLTTKLTSAMVLKYDLLLGLCFIQRRSWAHAFEALERVVTYPVKDIGCSKIMVEAYNKWLLVGLLLTGRTPTLPSTTAQSAQKSYQTLGKPYISICKAFEGDSAEVLKAEYESLGNQFWASDGNLGLIRLVVSHYQRWQIIDLHEVYTKISLEQIRRRTQSAETGGHLPNEAAIEALVQTMIDEGMLDGEIERPLEEDKPAHLTFLTSNDDLSEAEFAKRMKVVQKRIENLGPIIKATNQRLAASQEYLRYLSREQKKEQATNLSRNAGLSFDTIEDEDLMTGVVPGR